jgi:hypothetical protein
MVFVLSNVIVAGVSEYVAHGNHCRPVSSRNRLRYAAQTNRAAYHSRVGQERRMPPAHSVAPERLPGVRVTTVTI